MLNIDRKYNIERKYSIRSKHSIGDKYRFILFFSLFFSSLVFFFATGYITSCEALNVQRKEPSELSPNHLKNTGKNMFNQLKVIKKKISDKMRLSDQSRILESKNISDILSYVDRDTLVIFDIDYTLFHSKTCLGSPEWNFYLIQKEMKKGCSREISFNKHYPAWLKAQQFNDIELLDKKIPEIIKDVKHKALGFIALTSRQSSAAEITRWQLHKFDIEFNKSSLAEHTYISKLATPAVFREGVLFSHDFNEKGAVFAEWLEQVQPQIKRKRGIKRIVFVDDILENIVSVQAVAENLGLEFVGIRYARADNLRKNIHPRLVEQERAILMTNYSDTEIRLLLENAGSYEQAVDLAPG